MVCLMTTSLGGLKIIPYISVDGIKTIRNSEIESYFERMIKDRTAYTVFYDGFICTPKDFLRFVTQQTDLFLVAEWNGEPVGIAWYQAIAKGVAQGHFCAFSSIWGLDERIEIGRQVIKFALESFNTIVGYIPEFNNRALEYILAIGATPVASLPAFAYRPGYPPSPVTMIYFTRDQNENLH